MTIGSLYSILCADYCGSRDVVYVYTAAALTGGGLLTLNLLLCTVVTGIVCRYRRSVKHKLQLNSIKQVNSRDIFPGIERPNEAYNLVQTFTGNDSLTLGTSRVTRVSSRPLPSPAPVRGVRTPSPTHVYEEIEKVTVDNQQQKATT